MSAARAAAWRRYDDAGLSATRPVDVVVALVDAYEREAEREEGLRLNVIALAVVFHGAARVI